MDLLGLPGSVGYPLKICGFKLEVSSVAKCRFGTGVERVAELIRVGVFPRRS